MELLYTTLLYLIQPLVWLRLLLCSRKTLVYRKRWVGRYGLCQNKAEPDSILLHSVSVGETLVIIPLVRALRHHYPPMPITVTTMTPTDSKRAMSVFGKDAHRAYLPYDLPGATNCFLNTVQSRLVIVVEAELWPNMVAVLRRRKIPLVIANACLSERPTKGYAKPGDFMHRLLSHTTLIATQNEEDGNRFLILGLKRNQLMVTGNLKSDISIISELVARATTSRRQQAPHRKAWIATSIHDGGKQIILQARKKLLETFLNLLLILVPQHPERFPNARGMV